MSNTESTCPFCAQHAINIIAREGTVFAFYDKYPVTDGHMLIVPVMHRRHFFELDRQEVLDSWTLIHKLKTSLMHGDASIDGFNIGANCERSAGQTVFHCHIHLIPRRTGDMDQPQGGVRGVIPAKQAY